MFEITYVRRYRWVYMYVSTQAHKDVFQGCPQFPPQAVALLQLQLASYATCRAMFIYRRVTFYESNAK
jgi:hypothetical protein